MKVAIILHLHYQDLWPWFRVRLKSILQNNPKTDLYVSVNNLNTSYIKDISKYSKEVFLVENKGLDVAPFLHVCDQIKSIPYKYYIKIHGKKSIHTPELGEIWRTQLVDSFLHSNMQYVTALSELSSNTVPCMVGSASWLFSETLDNVNYLDALPFIKKALKLLNTDSTLVFKDKRLAPPFFAGTMFLVNDLYMKNLYNLIDIPSLLPKFEEGYDRYGSLAHGFERLLGYLTTTLFEGELYSIKITS